MAKSIKFFLSLLFLAGFLLPSLNALGNSEVVEENSPIYDELMQTAIKWKNAILNKDMNVLVNFALPEGREYIIPKLKDKNSELYRTLFKGKKSIYEILRKLKKIKIVMVKHEGLEEAGQGTTVYYYDEDRSKLRFPLTSDEEQKLHDQAEIVSKFFFKTEGQWFTSYEF